MEFKITNLKKFNQFRMLLHALLLTQKKIEHITPVLFNLHWLPVKQRIKFKIILLAFNIISSKCPDYLSSLIDFQTPSRTLRSSNKLLLTRRDTRYTTTNYGFRAFSLAAPKLWNELHFDISVRNCSLASFKILLKTCLFRDYFNTFL